MNLIENCLSISTRYTLTNYSKSLRLTNINSEVIKEEKTFVREEHATILYEDEKTLLVRPLTHRGSLKYGANTRWCTVSKDNPNTFKSYFDSNYLFYLIRKNKEGTKWDKIALQFPKQQNIFGDR